MISILLQKDLKRRIPLILFGLFQEVKNLACVFCAVNSTTDTDNVSSRYWSGAPFTQKINVTKNYLQVLGSVSKRSCVVLTLVTLE